MKKLVIPIVAAMVTSFGSFWAYEQLKEQPLFSKNRENNQPAGVRYVNNSGEGVGQPVDFSFAAENSVKSVVHIKTLKQGRTVMAQDPWDFWGDGGYKQYKMPDAKGSGSGVIISADGYIVTNNHVVDGADEVQVTFDNRNTQVAKVVGVDPSTDLAVLKIQGSKLPAMPIGNSDEVKLGQWVLAVGYPLNLDATVTAGIVSAKGRSIGLNRAQSKSAIESYIQTDAAVNPGNSGGALVNTQGHLVGINSAIASPTGSYAGYSYAVPSNLVKKVTADIIKFGSVQRGYLGATLIDMNNLTKEQATSLGISAQDYASANGVMIGETMQGSGAAAAGLKKGDFITAVNGVSVNTTSELIERVAMFHPGDRVQVDYMRAGNAHRAQVELRSQTGTVATTKATAGSTNLLGATFRDLTREEAKKLGVSGGVMVANLGNGALKNSTDMQQGFIIVMVNNQAVENVAALSNAISSADDVLQFGGVYAGKRGVYYYSMQNVAQVD